MQLKYGKITYKAFLSPIRQKIDLYMSYQCLHVYRAKFTSMPINLYLYTNNNNKIGRQKKNSPCLACLKIPILSKSLHASKAHWITTSFFFPRCSAIATKGAPPGPGTGNLKGWQHKDGISDACVKRTFFLIHFIRLLPLGYMVAWNSFLFIFKTT